LPLAVAVQALKQVPNQLSEIAKKPLNTGI